MAGGPGQWPTAAQHPCLGQPGVRRAQQPLQQPLCRHPGQERPSLASTHPRGVEPPINPHPHPPHTHATFFLVACPAVSYADIIRVTATAPMLLYGLEVGTFGPGVKLDQTITFRIGVYSGDSLYSPIKWGGVTIPGNTYVRDSRSVGFYRHSFSRTLLLNTGARGREGGGEGVGGADARLHPCQLPWRAEHPRDRIAAKVPGPNSMHAQRP